MIDLSKLLADYPGVTGGASMCATNMVSARPMFAPEGSESESVSGITPTSPGPVTPLPPADQDTLINDQVHVTAEYQFTQPAGGRWRSAPNEVSPGRSGTGLWEKVG